MRRFGSSPETRAIAPAAIQSAAIGAILLSLLFLATGFDNDGDHNFMIYFALVIGALVIGFVIGGIATGLVLMLAGVPIARLAGDRLERASGLGLALTVAAIGIACFYIIAVGEPLTTPPQLAAIILPLCFALPAALLYRKQVLLERGLDPA